MHVAQTKDTMSDLYLDAVRLRQRVFVAEQGVPEEMEIDEYEAHCIHFVLYTNHVAVATCRLLPLENGVMKLQRMAVEKSLPWRRLWTSDYGSGGKFCQRTRLPQDYSRSTSHRCRLL